MSRAELEARVRMELNRKLACINTFLQQRSEHLDKIDSVSDSRRDEIRAQLHTAERQPRVCNNNNNNNTNICNAHSVSKHTESEAQAVAR